MSEQELKLWFNGADAYVARDAEHARELMAEQTGERIDDIPSFGEWSKDDHQMLTIGDDDKGTQTKSVAEWIRENGPGFLFSTER